MSYTNSSSYFYIHITFKKSFVLFVYIHNHLLKEDIIISIVFLCVLLKAGSCHVIKFKFEQYMTRS